MAIGVILKKIKALERNVRTTFSYILNIDGRGRKGHKVEYSGSENFLHDRLDQQIGEMSERHKEYKKYGEKVTPDMHLVLSYPNNFIMTKEEYRKDVKTLLRHLGMENHACLWAVHTNTRKTHIHLYIDRIDPVKIDFDTSKGTCFETTKAGTLRRHESNCFQSACYEISKKYGLSTTQYLVDDKGNKKEYVKSTNIRVNSKDTNGYELAIEINNLINDFLKLENKSWEMFLSMLGENEIEYKTVASKTGGIRGAVFIDRETDYKLKSSVLPVGHKELEKTLGAFPFAPKPIPERTSKKKKIDNTTVKEEVKGKLKSMIEKSNSWLELHALLEAEGYCMEQRGASFSFVYAENNGAKECIAASKIDKTITFVKLKQKWGNPPEGIIKPFKKEAKEFKFVQKYERFGYYEDKKHETIFSLSKNSFYTPVTQHNVIYDTFKDRILSYKSSKISSVVTIDFKDGYTLKLKHDKIILENYKSENELIQAIHSMIEIGLLEGWKLESMVFSGSDFFKEKAYAILAEMTSQENNTLINPSIENKEEENENEMVL